MKNKLNFSELKYLFIICFFCLILPFSLFSQDTITKKEAKKQQKSFLIPGRPWTIEVPLWIPGFAGSFAYGDIEVEGEDGVEIENPIQPPDRPGFGDVFSRIFTTNWYLKFFFLTRIAYEKNRFIVQLDAISGSVGESTEFNYNQKQVVQVNFQTINIRLFAGYKFVNVYSKNKNFRYELFGYLGVRTHFHRIYSDFDGIINKLDINPTWTEPIIGLLNQFTWKRWFWVVQADYGGYIVDSKSSIQLSSNIYYRSGKITSLKAGWNHLILNHKGTFLKEDYKINASLLGPSVGIAFHF